MTRDPEIYIEDILESVALIEEYLEDVSKDEFLSEIGVQDKVMRRLEIIGEAVKNIPKEITDEYPDIPWKDIAGMRDMLAHEYFGINMKRVWKVASDDLPELQKGLDG
jgi:uncharacterized protein with HEPN domain